MCVHVCMEVIGFVSVFVFQRLCVCVCVCVCVSNRHSHMKVEEVWQRAHWSSVKVFGEEEQ